MPSELYLAIHLDDGSVERLRLDNRPIMVGRDASCDVVLPSSEVSRRHIALLPSGGQVRLTDKSANGTFVGNERALIRGRTVLLDPETPFFVGPYRMEVTLGGNQDFADLQAPTLAPGQGAAPAASMPIPRIEDSREAAKRISQKAASQVDRSGKYGQTGTRDVPVPLRRMIHRQLLSSLDLASLERNKMDEAALRPRVREALTGIVRAIEAQLPKGTDISALIEEITHEALGLGCLEVLIADETVSEIMVVDPETIFIERNGRLEHTALRFTDDDAVRSTIERIVTPLGRRIDESTPLVDARLKDGSRVNAVIPPLALRGPCITIRKFKKDPLTVQDLIKFGTLDKRMAKFLKRAVTVRKNIVISGGTGSGKTTLLNVLSASIPEEERVVTIEDAAELRLEQPHVVSLESRPPNMEGKGEITIRDLVKNALRMRPDRIVVGECRGGEALDMLQAMNTGHEGSMTTTHANSPHEALNRLETLALMSGLDLPSKAIREQIAGSIHVILQQSRFSDGSRRITAISEVVGINDNGEIEHRDIFLYHRLGTDDDGKIRGEFRATGYLPSFIDEFITNGLVKDGDFL